LRLLFPISFISRFFLFLVENPEFLMVPLNELNTLPAHIHSYGIWPVIPLFHEFRFVDSIHHVVANVSIDDEPVSMLTSR
jgi:hypothetical protein